MGYESTKDIYSSVTSVWPENDRWYDYTQKCIMNFIKKYLTPKLTQESVYLNAGSGGSEYDLPGICHHVDIAENLIKQFPRFTVASIENIPPQDCSFDAAICVGSVINYCDAVKSVSELSRLIKHDGYLILEFERSNTGELWFTKEYGRTTTRQQYYYMGHTHTLWLYSENVIVNILKERGFSIVKRKRFHSVSALINRITCQEEYSGRFSKFDPLALPFSYLTAHNVIMLCKKCEL